MKKPGGGLKHVDPAPAAHQLSTPRPAEWPAVYMPWTFSRANSSARLRARGHTGPLPTARGEQPIWYRVYQWL